jgi:hypothetical protein
MVRSSLFGRLGVVAGLFAALLVGLLAGPAAAVVPSPVQFNITFSPYARVLDAFDDKQDGLISAGQFMAIQMEESCDNPHLRIRARNKPAVMVINDGTSAAPITELTIKINDAGGMYAFGMGDVATDFFTNFVKPTIYSDAGVMITSSSASPDLRTLTINFSGLEAGKKAIFNIDLDPLNGMFMFPDYRGALFGAPLSPGDPPTTPATITALYQNNTAAPNTKLLTLNLPQMTVNPTWMNENIRPYHSMDMVEMMGGEIPEPGCIVLALPVVAAMAWRRGRAKRAA